MTSLRPTAFRCNVPVCAHLQRAVPKHMPHSHTRHSQCHHSEQCLGGQPIQHEPDWRHALSSCKPHVQTTSHSTQRHRGQAACLHGWALHLFPSTVNLHGHHCQSHKLCTHDLLNLQGFRGEAAAHLERVLPSAMLLDLRMGSQASLLAMADAFPSHSSIRHSDLDRFRQVAA